MLSGQAPFLAAIVANPDDDLPRLIYADWLEEHGHADRAEFIRLQTARYRTKEEKRYPRPMKARIAELKAAHEARWRAELPDLPGVTWGRFWCGFVSEAKFASPAALIEHAAAAFASSPIRVMQLSGLGANAVGAVCVLPQLGKLYGLRLDDVSLNPALWQPLTECRWFAQVEHLIVHPDNIEITPRPAPVDLRSLIPRQRRAAGRQQYQDSWIWHRQEQATRQQWGEELVRLVLAAAVREGARLRIAHLNLPFVDKARLGAAGVGRFRVTGLGPEESEFDPL